MEDVKKSIHDYRPNLKESTLNQYIAQLRKLKNVLEADDFEFLEYPENVKEIVENDGRHYTSQKNVYGAIVIYLKSINPDGEFDEYIDIYETWRNALRDQYVSEQTSGIISDKQSKNFISKIELDLFISKMRREIKNQPQLHMVYVIFEILSRYPLRNDLPGMILLTQKGFEKLSATDKISHNYLIKVENGFIIHDADHKTSKTHGTIKIHLDPDSPLAKILRSYIRVMKYKPKDNIFPVTPNYMSQLLIKYSSYYCGKSISSTMIRKIVSSDKFLESKESQKEHAHILGHSVVMDNLVYVKKAQP